ncbi:MAG TPA: c-type cytochrome [Gemmatimonadales bacterium]|nr:c-type cytochrome [Gemmatimonadales bacterium]
MARHLVSHALIALVVLAGCSRDRKKAAAPEEAAPSAQPAAGAEGLTPFELANGIGPVKEEITLGPVDKALAERGEKIFEEKCSACHKMGERYVGPALGDVTKRRTPAYIMNMILNPEEMYTRHPEAKKLLAEFLTQMANQGLTRDEARAVLEHLRTEGGEAK